MRWVDRSNNNKKQINAKIETGSQRILLCSLKLAKGTLRDDKNGN